MLSNKIYIHFFSEVSKYFFVVLFTFSAIVWAVQAVNYLDLIVDDGHAVSVYLGYSFLNISKQTQPHDVDILDHVFFLKIFPLVLLQ